MRDSAFRAIPLLEEYVPGSLIGGKYQLEEVVGRGGMGSVWRAYNVMLEMPVAIKLIRPEVRGADTTAMLLNEARLAAKLQHPSVVRLFDFGVAETGDAYIVMELLSGSSLADLLERQGRLSAVAAVRLLLPIVHGLSAAHRRGVVHLDLKPENVMITDAGVRLQPKLLDFGIAKRAGLRNNTTVNATLVGSPAYMSPEQACGSRDIDARADIWGICIVLYELVSGRVPFAADSVSGTMRAVVENEPAPLGGDDLGARDLWSILRQGLAKDRQHRFASARQLGDALAKWLLDRGEIDDVCGELLVSNWGPGARTRTGLRADRLERARNHAVVVRSTRATRSRSGWLGAAACLSVAVSAIVLLRMSAGGHDRLSTAVAIDSVTAQPREVTLSSACTDPGDAATLPLTAATPHDPRQEAIPRGRSADRSVTKAVAHSTALHAPARVTKRANKAVQRALTKEAQLGLKDPFE